MKDYKKKVKTNKISNRIKINLAKSAGFCFGVRRALKIARKMAESNKNIYMLGDIVHNEGVVKDIEKMGIKKIEGLADGKGKILLIRAHGASKKIYEEAKKLGYKIIDATCPKVRQIHKIAREQEEKGYQIIVIGDKKHDEVKGITGQLKNEALIIDNIKEIPEDRLKDINKVAVVVQSTQNIEKVRIIVDKLRSLVNEVRFFNTICAPTRIKQKEVKDMARDNDLMIIIGSKRSANTKRLYDISKSINKKTYWIQSQEDIKTEMFKKIKSVGVTAGASTPDWITEGIINKIKEIAEKVQ